MADFQIGDKVLLKSGSPVMTVSQFKGGVAECVWFDGNKKLSDYFVEGILEIYNPDDYPGIITV